MGEAVKPFKNLVIASFFKIIGLYYLTAIPSLGILGSAISLSISYFVMTILNYLDLNKLIGYKINLSHDIIKPILAALGMAVFIWQIKKLFAFSSILTLVLALPTGCVVYLILLFLLGGFHREDILSIKQVIWKRF